MYTDTLLRVIIMSPLRWGWEIIQLSLLHYIQTSKFTDIDINIKRQKTEFSIIVWAWVFLSNKFR